MFLSASSDFHCPPPWLTSDSRVKYSLNDDSNLHRRPDPSHSANISVAAVPKPSCIRQGAVPVEVVGSDVDEASADVYVGKGMYKMPAHSRGR